MKIYFSLLLSLLCFSGITAPWDLFPLHQKSYYFTPQAFYTMNSVELHTFDSTQSRLNETIHYAKYNLDLQGALTCYEDTLQYLYWLRDGLMHVDSLIYRNDTVFYFSPYSTLPFYFLPLANPGQSWTVNSDYPLNDYSEITITCTAIQIDSIAGISDSVKVFSLAANGTSSGQVPVSNFEIRLSKSFGFVEFVPLPLFLYHPSGINFYSLELIGLIDTAGLKHGYQQPGFSDFFNLSAGDILAWEHHHDGWNVFDWSEYYKDSITSVIKTPDSVIYTYDRLVQDTDLVFTQYFNLGNKFFKSEFRNILDAPSQWLGLGNNRFGFAISSNSVLIWETGDLTLEFDTLSGDTISSFSFTSQATSVDTTNCNVYEAFDLYYSFSLNSRLGITESCYANFTTDCTRLIGSRVSGVETGNITLSIDENQANHLQTLRVYPNPAGDLLFFNKSGGGRYLIINQLGEVMLSGEFNQSFIEVDKLVNGIYIIQIEQMDKMYYSRFVRL
jgi:hypothetical protein